MLAFMLSTWVASLVGSPHCAGMCGPFVAFYAGKEKNTVFTHVAYHAARVLVYGALGAAAGALGERLNALSAHYGVPEVAALLACVAIVLWSAGVLWGAHMPSWFTAHTQKPFHAFLVRTVGRCMRWLRDQPSQVKAACLGGLTGLLPCGFLYGFVTVAAGTGSWWQGMWTMVAFWAGTVPVLAFLGAATQSALKPLLPRVQKSLACVLLVVGLWGVFIRFPHMLSHTASSPASDVPSCHPH